MTEDIKNVLGTDADEAPVKKKPPQPTVVHLRYSKVLSKYVLCLESDHEAVPYHLAR